jgi:hypothetical protein
MFHLWGTAASASMPMRRRRPSLASQLVEDGLGGDVTQGGSEDDDAPEDGDRIVVASLAASVAKRLEELAIGQGGEEILDGLQGGTVFEFIPGEERVGGVNDHHGNWVETG